MADAQERSASDRLMQLDVSQIDRAVVLSVTGEIDMLTAPRLRDAVKTAVDELEAAVPIVVDLSHVSFLDSVGLAALVEASSAASAGTGTQLRVVVGEAHTVIRPLELSGLGGWLPIYRTVDDALAVTGDDR